MTAPLAVVIGARGGIGAAMVRELARDHTVIGLSRASDPPLDLLDEASVARAAAHVGEHVEAPSLVFDATGFLHDADTQPEKSWRRITPEAMERNFRLNAIGPALLVKHFVPRLARGRFALFASISARVGSIADNRLGGWYAYRAAKAAQNQILRTAAIELARTRKDAAIVALHPGTVDTALSAPFAKTGLTVRAPHEAATALGGLLRGLGPAANGRFFAYDGEELPW